MNPKALRYVNEAEAERLNTLRMELAERKSTLQKQVKDSKAARQPAKVIRAIESDIKIVESELKMVWDAMPLQYVVVPEAIESIAQEVEARNEYPKLLKSFNERLASDPAWAIESLGDDVFAAQYLGRKLINLAETIRTKATTLEQASAIVEEFKTKLERECLDMGLMNSTNIYNNALELAKYELMRKFLRWGEIGYVTYEIEMFQSIQAKYLAAMEPTVSNGNGSNGGAIVGLDA